ncbi:MAG: hypothetical protein K9H48_20150 [Melioribacteraceae bacterium]|nr:hypothetical protein [Melioribacteraceae bacterium]MCF8396119.1 hypothetical protein [Melioribacteraceae bacterium]MCF8421096.1 hypothetical protein [Melioribacteraceae bacterium]
MRIVTTFILLLITSVVSGQYFPSWNVLTVEDGLSQNSINDIMLHSEGYLYIATNDGLDIYDGSQVTLEEIKLKDSTPASVNRITALYEDTKNNLWVGTGHGRLFRKNDNDDYYKAFKIPAAGVGLNPLTNVRKIIEDNSGNIWILTEDEFCKFDINQGELREVRLPKEFFDQKAGNRLLDIDTDSGGGIWMIAEYNKLLYFNISANQFLDYSTLIDYNDDSPVKCMTKINDSTIVIITDKKIYNVDILDISSISNPHNFTGITTVTKDHRNNIWVGTGGTGVYRMKSFFCNDNDIEGFSTQLVQRYSYSSIISLEYLPEGVLLIGTNGDGLSQIDYSPSNFNLLRLNPGNPKSLFNRSIRVIQPLDEEEIIVGGYSGLEKINLKTNNFTVLFDIREITGGSAIYSSYRDESDPAIFWFGTEGGGLLRYNLETGNHKRFRHANKTGANLITYIIPDDEKLLLATAKGVHIFNRRTGVFEAGNSNLELITRNIFISQLSRDSLGNIICGTYGNGLLQFGKNYSLIKNVHLTEEESINSSADIIKCITFDLDGDLLIGTEGSGIFRLNQSIEILSHLSTANGLPNDVIYGIIPDSENNYWISTNKGISKYDQNRKVFTNYTSVNGLQSNEFNTNAYAHVDNNLILFGGINGINYFYADGMKDKKIEKPINIVRVSSGDKVYEEEYIEANPKIEFGSSVSEVVIDFNFLVFSKDVVHEFLYRLKGYDDDWESIANKRSLTFRNINHGEYEFEIKTLHNYSDQVTRLSFVIHPPFYKSLWFTLGLVAFFLMVVPAIIYKRIKRLSGEKEVAQSFLRQLMENQEVERKRISYALHDSIGQQLILMKMKLRKYFDLFEKDKKENESSQEIMQLLTSSIEDIRNISHNLHPHLLEKIGLTKSIDALLNSLSEIAPIKIDFELDNVDNNFSSEQSLDFYRFVQEAVNNVIKHSEAENCFVEIKNNKDWVLIISDDGIGFDNQSAAKSKKKFGLKSLNERAAALGAEMIIETSHGNGTKIRLTKR